MIGGSRIKVSGKILTPFAGRIRGTNARMAVSNALVSDTELNRS
jgi:hypothetical protein